MSILVITHVAHEGPAELGRLLQEYGHRLRQVSADSPDWKVDLNDLDALIIMGGPQNVDEVEQFPFLAKEMDLVRLAHQAGKPIVGVCLGAQLIAAALGGQVAAMANGPEVGWQPIRLSFFGSTDPIFGGIPWNSQTFHLHGQEVTQLPPAPLGVPLAGSKACRNQAFRVGLRTYGFQYHFEWSLSDLKTMVSDALVSRAGAVGQDILKQAEEHYAGYRRLGDRLTRNIAEYLFPPLK